MNEDALARAPERQRAVHAEASATHRSPRTATPAEAAWHAGPRQAAQRRRIETVFPQIDGPDLRDAGMAGPAGAVIQCDWDKSYKPELLVWKDVVDGLRWFYNQKTGRLSYVVMPALYGAVKIAHLRKLEAYAGTEHTYEEWQAAGWGGGGRNEALAQAIEPPRGAQVEAPREPKDFGGVTAGVEQEIKGAFQVRTDARGRLGEVCAKAGGETLVEFETDMQNKADKSLFTLEFKTTPCALDDADGLSLRAAAQRLLTREIRVAGGQPKGTLAEKEDGPVRLVVYRRNFEIVKPSPKMSFANQLTMGVRTTDLLGATGAAVGEFRPAMTDVQVMGPKAGTLEQEARGREAAKLILTAAFWFEFKRSAALMDEFRQRTKGVAQGLGPGVDGAAACFNLLTQLIWFMSDQMMDIAKRSARQAAAGGGAETDAPRGHDESAEELGSTVIGPEGCPIVDTSLPIYKNAFGTLPKTSPMHWIASLPGPWQAVVRSQVSQPPKSYHGPANVYASVWKFIQMGQALAGHPIPVFTIQGEQAVAFEFRSMPSSDEKLKSLKYSE
jgi:hypothetical protein